MTITTIKQQVKDQNRVSVFVDGAYAFSLSLDELLDVGLKKGQTVTTEELANFKKKSADGKLRSKSLAWVMSRPHSSKELRDYLHKNKADKELATSILADFEKRGYVNDEHFTEWFVELRLRKNHSIRAIRAELKTKGISEETIQSVVSREQDHLGVSDVDALYQLVNKLRKKSRYNDEKKLLAYLISKGFAYSDIKQVLMEQDRPEDLSVSQQIF